MTKTDQLHFLVVDDHSSVRKTLRDSLVGMGYSQVHQAGNVGQAIELLNQQPIGALISDWNMPGQSGLELLQYVRNQPRFNRLPFLMVTAEVQRDSVLAAINAGVSDFLVKPFNQQLFRYKVAQLIAHPELRMADRGLEADTEEPASTTEDPASATILVVDDVPTNLELMAGILKPYHRVKVANSGQKALQILAKGQQIDLVLLDVEMPEVGGYEVCRLIKSDSNLEHIPVIFLTARSEVKDVAHGFELGAVDYISKPADPTILRARIDTQLQLKRSRDQLKQELKVIVENARLQRDVERMTRHDIKNPLSSIIGTAELMLESHFIGADDLARLRDVKDSAYNILGIINRSLDIYKMETGSYKLKAESFNLTELLRKVVTESRVMARKKRVKVIFERKEECWCLAEPLLCISLFGNLIKNAVEASEVGDEVTVKLNDAEQPKVRIHNTQAVPVSIRSRFFSKDVSASEGGSGLGTYSAKLMTDVQGGSIEMQTSDDEGTQVSVRLPGGSGDDQ